MGDRRAPSGLCQALRCEVLTAVVLAVLTGGCQGPDGERSIRLAPEQSAPSAPAPLSTPTAPSIPTVSAPNPLAMPLKHDGPAPPPTLVAVDPCARPEPRGPLAMPLRHDGSGRPHQPNPLCMRLK